MAQCIMQAWHDNASLADGKHILDVALYQDVAEYKVQRGHTWLSHTTVGQL